MIITLLYKLFMRILFICSQNVDRSRTAEEMFKDRDGYEAKSSGLYCEGERRVKKGLVEWADRIFVMEERQKEELFRRFPDECMKKEIISLEIYEPYPFNHPELRNLIWEKTKRWLR